EDNAAGGSETKRRARQPEGKKGQRHAQEQRQVQEVEDEPEPVAPTGGELLAVDGGSGPRGGERVMDGKDREGEARERNGDRDRGEERDAPAPLGGAQGGRGRRGGAQGDEQRRAVGEEHRRAGQSARPGRAGHDPP